jgi:DNA repair photolyase
VIRLGGMTDCFQPLEVINESTYHTILWLNRYKIHYLIVTKSDLVADDKYIAIYDKLLAHFQITITGTNDKKCLEYEKAPPVSKRIKAIEKLYKLGFDVSVRLSPFIYQFCDLEVINSIQCNKILIEFLKVNHWIKKWFNINYTDYSLKHGGYEHLQLSHKIDLVNVITGFDQVSVGEYVKTHYEYFRDNVNFNKFDCCNLSLPEMKLARQTKLFEDESIYQQPV